MTSFSLGRTSRANLSGVAPSLVSVVERAIKLTTADFIVFEGLRTLERQQRLVAAGASQTLESKHRVQADGYGHAVDLVPWIDGDPRWEWGPIYDIASAVRQAATELKVSITWGGCWRVINGLPPGPEAMEKAISDYVAARRRAGQRAFNDGPHYQLA